MQFLGKQVSLNTRSVRFRTAAGATLALIVLLAATGLAINWFVGREVQRSFDATLLEQATDRAALVGDGAAVDSLMSPVGAEEIVAAIDSSGTVLASSGLEVPSEVADLPLGLRTIDALVLHPGEGPELERLRVAVAESSTGVRIVVGNEGESSKRTRSGVRNMLLGVIPLTALAGAAVAWFVTGRALRPVKNMRDELDDVVSASGGRRVTRPGTRDEIDMLGATINGVLDRLDEQSLAQRRFVADASHELKSPLANARVVIDTAAPDTDAQEYDRVISAVDTELNRLHALIDDLLYLARGDERAPRNPTTTDLADLVFDECERVAATTSKRVDASQVVPVAVVVDASEVARAVRNLLENAVRFAAERVRVSVQVSDEIATVVVADDGPGIAEEDRERVFDRFRRIDTDRARSAGGTGLGLSIVASIATRNAGAVSLTDAAEGGAQFELTLPRAN